MLLKVPRQRAQARTPTKLRAIARSFLFLVRHTIPPAHRPILTVGFIWWLHATRCWLPATRCCLHPGSTLSSSSDKLLWKQTSQHEKQFGARRSESASRKCLISDLLTLTWRFPKWKGKLWIFIFIIKIGLMWMWVLNQWTINLPPPQGLICLLLISGESMKERRDFFWLCNPSVIEQTVP